MLTRHDDVWASGTHIIFRRVGKSESGKTNVYAVLTKENVELGSIAWFGRWRKYSFDPKSNTTYEQTCLREIAQFIEEETSAHKSK